MALKQREPRLNFDLPLTRVAQKWVPVLGKTTRENKALKHGK